MLASVWPSFATKSLSTRHLLIWAHGHTYTLASVCVSVVEWHHAPLLSRRLLLLLFALLLGRWGLLIRADILIVRTYALRRERVELLLFGRIRQLVRFQSATSILLHFLVISRKRILLILARLTAIPARWLHSGVLFIALYYLGFLLATFCFAIFSVLIIALILLLEFLLLFALLAYFGLLIVILREEVNNSGEMEIDHDGRDTSDGDQKDHQKVVLLVLLNLIHKQIVHE